VVSVELLGAGIIAMATAAALTRSVPSREMAWDLPVTFRSTR
jgi:hypothetical protein